MPKLSACLEMFYTSLPFEERIARAAQLGLKFFEFWGWSSKDLESITQAAASSGIGPVICTAESDRRLVDPNAGQALEEGLLRSIDAARTLGIDRFIMVPGGERPRERFEVTRRTVVRNLRRLAPVLEREGITLNIEPLNPVVDHPALWLTRMSDAVDIAAEVASPRVKVLMDIYHQQVTEGNIIATILEYLPWIGHFHCAGVPGRHELVGGELDYGSIFRAIDEAGYDGYIGLEFSSERGDDEALREAMDLAD